MTKQVKSSISHAEQSSVPIDAVIAWVDGNDPEHQKKMAPYLDSSQLDVPGMHPTRFMSVNEIRYCLLSIYTFAPFVRNVYVVTDNQDPELYDDIKTCFPDRLQSFRIVDHREIFRGYEEYLPIFNSRAIETMLWRIEGLSDSFIYFNDDTFLIKKVYPEDFFIDGRPVLRGNWIPAPYPRVWWNSLRGWVAKKVLLNKNYHPRPSYHLGQWAAARQAGFRWRYFYFNHTPYSISRTTAKRCFASNEEVIRSNISYRFRNHEQFNFNSLLYHTEIKYGNRLFSPPSVIYMTPYKRGKTYIQKKLKQSTRNPQPLFMCVQSLDRSPASDQKKIYGWLEKKLNLTPV